MEHCPNAAVFSSFFFSFGRISTTVTVQTEGQKVLALSSYFEQTVIRDNSNLWHEPRYTHPRTYYGSADDLFYGKWMIERDTESAVEVELGWCIWQTFHLGRFSQHSVIEFHFNNGIHRVPSNSSLQKQISQHGTQSWIKILLRFTNLLSARFKIDLDLSLVVRENTASWTKKTPNRHTHTKLRARIAVIVICSGGRTCSSLESAMFVNRFSQVLVFCNTSQPHSQFAVCRVVHTQIILDKLSVNWNLIDNSRTIWKSHFCTTVQQSVVVTLATTNVIGRNSADKCFRSVRRQVPSYFRKLYFFIVNCLPSARDFEL